MIAGTDSAYAASDLVSKHADSAVRGPEVLQTVDSDGTLRNLRLVVAGMPLPSLIGICRDLAREHDVAIRPPRRRNALRLADMSEFDEHRVVVIDGHNPAAHHRAAEGMF